jgi:hypothetical protein
MRSNAKIKTNVVFASIVLTATLLSASAAQSDPRFDGKWVGTETLTPTAATDPDLQKRLLAPHPITIVITEGGTLVGRLGGVCYGRYRNVHRTGDTLTFGAGDCKLSVTLAKDGQSLTEKGSCKLTTAWAVRIGVGGSGTWPVSWLPLQITGTFRRTK